MTRGRSERGARTVWALVASLTLAGGAACGQSASDGATAANGGDGGPSGGGGDAGGALGDGQAEGVVDALTIDPPSATLHVQGGVPVTQTFTAMGSTGGGAPVAVHAQFTVDSVAAGDIGASTGTFTASGVAGGVVHVTATYGGKTATATLTVVLERDVTIGSVPPSPGTLFDPPNTVVKGDPTNAPSLVYPVDDTMFPQNIYRVLFQWNKGTSALYQLEFKSPLLTYRVYTDGSHATCTAAGTGGGCWESDQAAWTALAASNAGQAVAFTIRATNPSAPGKVYEAGPYTLHFSQDEVPGALYYWSTTVAGVRRGALGDPAPQNFLTPAEADVGGETLTVVDVSQTTPPPVVFGTIGQPATNIPSSWATFSPDTSRVVASKKGVLKLFNGSTGAPIGANGGIIPLGAGNLGVQPDWAPDGQHIVFGAGNADRKGSTKIAWMSVSGDTFSGFQALLTATGTETFGYPMWNPTSEWVSFARGTAGVEKDGTDQVNVIRATPGSTPQALVRANTLVNNGTVATGVENNMPTWAPTSKGGVQWIAFASLRDYGFVLRSGSKIGVKMQQLWIAAIDTSKLGAGDPSYPAFRVPFVDLEENCHRPFWAEDAVHPPPATDAGAPDAGGVFDAGVCATIGQDCTSARCCGGLVCDNVNDTYVCDPKIN